MNFDKYTQLCSHHNNQNIQHFHLSKILLCPPAQIIPSNLQPQTIMDVLSTSLVFALTTLSLFVCLFLMSCFKMYLFIQATLHGIWDLHCSTREQSLAPCIESEESYPLDHQGIPYQFVFKAMFVTYNLYTIKLNFGIQSCNHHLNQDMKYHHHTKNTFALLQSFVLLLPQSQETTDLFFSLSCLFRSII